MAIHKGRAVRVEVAATLGTAKSVSAITKANPGVATSSSHAMAEGTIGFFTAVGGMIELEDQVASVDSTALNTFNLEGIDTTNFTTFSGTANFTPVATWTTLSTVTGYDIGGGEITQLDTTTLLDNQMQEEAGMLGRQTLSLNSFADLQAAGVAQINAAARAGTMVVLRITLSNGERRICRGYPSLPSESLSVNQVASASVQIITKKQLLMLPAA